MWCKATPKNEFLTVFLFREAALVALRFLFFRPLYTLFPSNVHNNLYNNLIHRRLIFIY